MRLRRFWVGLVFATAVLTAGCAHTCCRPGCAPAGAVPPGGVVVPPAPIPVVPLPTGARFGGVAAVPGCCQ